jgi:hypothetical protein
MQWCAVARPAGMGDSKEEAGERERQAVEQKRRKGYEAVKRTRAKQRREKKRNAEKAERLIKENLELVSRHKGHTQVHFHYLVGLID